MGHCADKIRYREASAKKAALVMTTKKGEPFEAYQCAICRNWHVGHALYTLKFTIQR